MADGILVGACARAVNHMVKGDTDSTEGQTFSSTDNPHKSECGSHEKQRIPSEGSDPSDLTNPPWAPLLKGPVISHLTHGSWRAHSSQSQSSQVGSRHSPAKGPQE